jgi:hypothetical protein
MMGWKPVNVTNRKEWDKLNIFKVFKRGFNTIAGANFKLKEVTKSGYEGKINRGKWDEEPFEVKWWRWEKR